MDHSLNYSSSSPSRSGKLLGATKINNKNNQSDGSNEEEEEESGWTEYFEDFSRGIDSNNNNNSQCSSLGGSSLVSDAASSAAWKFSHHHNQNNQIPNKLSFKKARAKQISKDDPLEDTASSPVNSPKVRDLNPSEIISRKINDQLEGSMGKGFTSSENFSDLQMDNIKHEENFSGKNIDCTDLKKRGLCLVPFSMLVNYLG